DVFLTVVRLAHSLSISGMQPRHAGNRLVVGRTVELGWHEDNLCRSDVGRRTHAALSTIARVFSTSPGRPWGSGGASSVGRWVAGGPPGLLQPPLLQQRSHLGIAAAEVAVELAGLFAATGGEDGLGEVLAV